MSEKREDRRVLRSRRALRDALVSLVIERGWDNVSIQEVCERADVGRSTFYAHFGDKEELLVSGLDELRSWLRASSTSGVPLSFIEPLCAHVDEQRRMFSAVVGRKSGRVVQSRFQALIFDLVLEDLSASATDERERTLAAHYVTGALLAVLSAWIERRDHDSSAIAGSFRRLTAPLLEVLASPPEG